MRKYEYPFFADWFAISLRWLVLVGVAYSLVIANTFNYYLAAAVLAGILWNFLSTLLAIFNRRLRAHRILNVLFDFLGTSILFFFSRGFYGPLSWVGLLNLFSAGIYYGWGGSMILAVVISTMQIMGSIYIFDVFIKPLHIALLAGFNLLSGLLFGMLSQQLYSQLREYFYDLQASRWKREEELRLAERQRMYKLFHTLEELNQSLREENALPAVLDLCEQAITDLSGQIANPVSAILLFAGDQLKISEARGFPAGDYQLEFPAKKGALLRAMQESKIIHLYQPADDPELNRLLVLRECQSTLILPVMQDAQPLGVMLFAHPESDYFNHERQDLLEMMSHQAAIIIQNARYIQEIETEHERLLRTWTEERRRFARELHDGPNQLVNAVSTRAEFIRQHLKEGDDESGMKEEVEQIEKLAQKTTREIRHLLFALQPPVVEKEGLVRALHALAADLHGNYQQELALEVDEEIALRLDLDRQQLVFKIVEEAVNNARKHAQASMIKVQMRRSHDSSDLISLEVLDNGVGFNIDEARGVYRVSGSLGMLNLQEYSERIGGRLKIESSPGKGTHIRVAFPLMQAAASRLQSSVAKR